MKAILILFLLLLLPALGISQYTVKGTISDADTGKKIAQARIENADEQSISKHNGTFSIEAYSGENILKISHLSYQTKTYKIILDENNPEVVLDIELKVTISELEETVITATRSTKTQRSIPYNISIIDKNTIELSSYNSVDDLLQQAAGTKIFRPMGFFQHSPSAGLAGSGNIPGRTLILMDGVPLNKADNGNVNLNRIAPELIERIEIMHNGSAGIYGSNAVNGVINIISKEITRSGMQVFAELEAASYGTYRGSIGLSGLSGNEKFSYHLSGNYRQSNGFISTPDSLREPQIEYIPSWLNEYFIEFSGTYKLSENHTIGFTYNYFDDERSTGEKILEPDGAYNMHDTQFAHLKYSGKQNSTNWHADFYFLREDYFRLIERMRQNDYSLTHVNSTRTDIGSSLHLTRQYLSGSNFTAGLDYRQGKVHGIDDYINSGDKVHNKGVMNQIDFYVQNQNTFYGKLHLIQSLRYAHSRIDEASFTIENSTPETDFMLDYTGSFEPHSKQKTIASIAAKYNLSSSADIAFGYNPGFRNPTLDDMTRSGLMYLGFKTANPNLQPEWSNNFYIAADMMILQSKISINAAYNQGHNYMYHIQTGESVLGGRRPVVQLQNITEVRTKSIICDISQKLGQNVLLHANYTYNEARIQRFEEMPESEGKILTYNPIHTANIGINGKSKIVNFGASLHYRSKQFTTDDNSEYIDPFNTVNVLLSKQLFSNFTLELSAQNIFDNRFLVYYSQESMGRFLSTKIQYRWQ